MKRGSETKQKRIGIYCDTLLRGGAERVTTLLAGYLYEHGRAVTVITAGKGPEGSEYSLPNSICWTHLFDDLPKNTLQKNLRQLAGTFRLRRCLREEKIDILLVMSVPLCIYAIPAAFRTKTKVVVSERNAPEHFAGKKITRILSRALMTFADGFIFQTNDAKRFYDKKLHGRGKVIFNPLNAEKLPEPYVGTRDKRIVSVGRLTPQKNQKMLLEAFSQIAEDFPDHTLEIYGEGAEREALQRIIDSKDLSDRVRLMGNVTNIYQKIRSASLFVFTSDFEGMPNALIEAMALGLPCISTDCPCGGPKELIESGNNGVLIPVGDVEAVAQSMRWLLLDKETAAGMGRQALAIRNRLDINRIGKMWSDYLLHL